MSKKFYNVLAYITCFTVLLFIFLEVAVRVSYRYEFFPETISVVDESTAQFEDIEYNGKVIKDAFKKGTILKTPAIKQTTKINSYSGFYDDFDDNLPAIRFLTIGSSYTAGWGVSDDLFEKGGLYSHLAARALSTHLGCPVQFADASANGNGGNGGMLGELFTIYGAKAIKKGLDHDYLLLELSRDAFYPTSSHFRGMANPKGGGMKFVNNSYAFRFFKLIFQAVWDRYVLLKWEGTAHSLEGRKRIIADQLKDYTNKIDEIYNVIYSTDRPHYDLDELRKTSASMSGEVAARSSPNDGLSADINTAMPLIDIDMAVLLMAEIRDLAGTAGVKMVGLLFPEFTKDELIYITHKADELGIDLIYIDELRNYTDPNIWMYYHHGSALGQRIFADSIVKGLLNHGLSSHLCKNK